jgi:hypothetical protein
MHAILDRLKAEATWSSWTGHRCGSSRILRSSAPVDGTLLVIAAGQPADAVRTSGDLLARARARVLGCAAGRRADTQLISRRHQGADQSTIIATRAGRRKGPRRMTVRALEPPPTERLAGFEPAGESRRGASDRWLLIARLGISAGMIGGGDDGSGTLIMAARVAAFAAALFFPAVGLLVLLVGPLKPPPVIPAPGFA